MLSVQLGRETSKLIIILTHDNYMDMSKRPMNPEGDMTAWDGRAKDSFINKSMFKLLQNNDCLYLSFSLLCTVEGYLLGALFILVLENVGYFFILVPKCNFYNSFPLHLPPKCELAIVQVCCFCFSIGTEINERKTFYTLWKKSHSFIFKTFSNTLTLYGKNTT